jgi:hypothetical protein
MRKLLPIVRGFASRGPPHGSFFPIFDRKSMKTKIESWPRLATSLLFDSSGHIALVLALPGDHVCRFSGSATLGPKTSLRSRDCLRHGWHLSY